MCVNSFETSVNTNLENDISHFSFKEKRNDIRMAIKKEMISNFFVGKAILAILSNITRNAHILPQ